jgi:hypothetical protein
MLWRDFYFSDRSRFRDFRDRDVGGLDLFLPAAGLAVSRLRPPQAVVSAG